MLEVYALYVPPSELADEWTAVCANLEASLEMIDESKYVPAEICLLGRVSLALVAQRYRLVLLPQC